MFGKYAGIHVVVSFVQLHTDAALVDDASVLFLDLEEDGAVIIRDAVGTQAELFFIQGLFKRGLDQLVVTVIEVDVADVGLAVFVDSHIRFYRLDQIFVLLLCEHVFFLDSFEDVSESHSKAPFCDLITGWIRCFSVMVIF